MTSYPPYSYAPERLLESFRKLKSEEDKEQRVSSLSLPSSSPPPPSSSCVDGKFVVAAVQLTASGLEENNVEGFLQRAEEAVRIAAEEKKADLVLLPELFLGPYFCQSQEASLQNLAMEIQEGDDERYNFLIEKMQGLAKRYGVVLPVSLFERKGNVLYNSVIMIDADGSVLPDTYRKSHIPDGTGYQEKFYFSPGDTGFKVWKTRVGKVGVAICWDQWFPEAARAMALMGADVILYPTAIGTEPQDPSINSADHWQRVMQGHAAANMVPVVASNRYGTEILLQKDGTTEKQRITFYGRSFITDETGAKVAEVDADGEKPILVIASSIDPEANRSTRLAWGLFRDRRPDLYGVLLTKDGSV
uniref:CN hydrolase domain-containing protein n=1 Tax=Pseudo-nitzschia australis TaxID=44445 RepID=A0A7S4AAB2_9STRA|mmetsp:Transcript_6963/g.14809  ORF Transcript_6963/g.14809 Transcript_6963/m.14809 type:complete len:361 (-) Transcript_6963:189-1271(-)|eukprot:CAMPEP_0168192862 /NCGR_PEP_ID=MMETSP0139_2-20121125/18277_1 /TAXON_ID=44445 /ORGANISM="Pseudo-nitzschia australis, Strain 10249 10 AB" /LENGTH=360 /DNA_ID=CAMNT_0008116135 /DNA_START=96 /DNA_END=1178 /DNA_ORIENTATION=+